MFDSLTNLISYFPSQLDIFESRIPISHLKNFFPEYNGGNTYEPALNFLKDIFQKSDKNENKRSIYFHETCATDTKNIKFVWDAVHDILLNLNFDKYY